MEQGGRRARQYRLVEGYTALPARTFGPAAPGVPTLVLLHGFTQTGESWAPLVDHLAGYRLLAPDAPGHGAASSVAADLWATADLLAATLAAGGVERANWAGYSMGGRMLLHLALSHPERVAKLVFISTSAGIEDPGERAARRRADESLAERIEEGGNQGLQAFLTEWLAQPLFATLPADRAGLGQRLANTPAGLASSLRLAGAGAQEPLWGRLHELGDRGIPVLLIAGELDRKYSDQAAAMVARIGPSARTHVVLGAGHACHLERPEEVAGVISRWLS